MASTRGLQPRFRRAADRLVAVARRLDPRFRITSGRRTTGEQVQLYQRWLRGDPGIYTPAAPGTSMHERGWALDIARGSVDPKGDPVLFRLGREWRSYGGVWGGASDPVHFEAPRTWTGRAQV